MGCSASAIKATRRRDRAASAIKAIETKTKGPAASSGSVDEGTRDLGTLEGIQAAAAIKRRETIEANLHRRRFQGEEARRPVVAVFKPCPSRRRRRRDPTATPAAAPSRHRPPRPPPATPAPSPTTLRQSQRRFRLREASPRRRCSSSLRRAVGCATCGLLDGAGTNYIRRETLTDRHTHSLDGGWWMVERTRRSGETRARERERRTWGVSATRAARERTNDCTIKSSSQIGRLVLSHWALHLSQTSSTPFGASSQPSAQLYEHAHAHRATRPPLASQVRTSPVGNGGAHGNGGNGGGGSGGGGAPPVIAKSYSVAAPHVGEA